MAFRYLKLLTALPLAIVVIGCGDADADRAAPLTQTPAPEVITDPAPMGSLERDPFIRRADEICLATDRALARAELQEFGKPDPDEPGPTTAERQRFHDEVVFPTRRSELELLRKLEPSAAYASAVDEWLLSFEEGVRVLGRDFLIIRDPAAAETAFDDAIALATAIGMSRCGNAPKGDDTPEDEGSG